MDNDFKLPQIRLDDHWKFLDPLAAAALACFLLHQGFKYGYLSYEIAWFLGVFMAATGLVISYFIYRRYTVGWGRGHHPSKLRWPHILLPASGIIATGVAYNLHFLSLGWALAILVACLISLLFIGYRTSPNA